VTKHSLLGRYFLALALLLVTTFAQATPPHQDWTRAAATTLPVYFEDRATELAGAKDAQLTEISRVVAEVSREAPRPPREWAALLLTIGYHESTFSLRIHRGDCHTKKGECDAGRARSGWQLHRNLFTAPVWDQLFGLEHTEVQVRAADAALRRGYWTCARAGVPWLQATINGFAGKRCNAEWPGLEKRIATWSRLVRTGTPSGGAS
jgi:hypothetical protein